MTNRRIASVFVGTLVLAATGCGRHAEPSLYLLPDGFVGNAYVIFGVEDGEPPEYEQGARLYRFPESGILRTRLPPNPGSSWAGEKRFFLVNRGTTRREIKTVWVSTIHDTPENRNNPAIGVFAPGMGVKAAQMPDGNTWSSEAPCAVTYEYLFVGTKSDVLRLRGDTETFDTHLRSWPVPCSEGDA